MKWAELSRDWIERNLTLFHILELNELKKDKKITSSRSLDILGSFDSIRLRSLINSDFLILLDGQLLIKKLDTFLHEHYSIYDLKEVNNFLDHGRFTITENRHTQKGCLLEIGNSCWRYSHRYLFQMVGSFSI